MNTSKLYTTFAAVPLLGLISSLATAQTTLVEHNYTGSASTLLDGTTIDTYDSALTIAGGSSTWKAEGDQGAPWTGFKADGSAAVFRSNASINLGSYINAAKGATDGIFELTATMAKVSANYASLGFGVDNEPLTRNEPAGGTSQLFNNAGSFGVSTVVYRSNGGVDLFGGRSLAGAIDDAATGQTGAQTFTIRVDLSTWDGSNDWGNVSFSQNGSQIGSHTYGQDQDFGSILMTILPAEDANYSNLSLTQIPEPASFGLTAALFGLALCGARRRRK